MDIKLLKNSKMKRTLLCVLILSFLLLVFSFRGKKIVIIKSEHLLEVYQGIWKIKSFPVTTGGESSPTSNGGFSILNKIENVESYHGYTFPLWLGVYKVGPYENGIHSVKEENSWDECIGVSNCTPGSIIMYEQDMEWLYEWGDLGVVVTIDI